MTCGCWAHLLCRLLFDLCPQRADQLGLRTLQRLHIRKRVLQPPEPAVRLGPALERAAVLRLAGEGGVEGCDCLLVVLQ